MDLSPDSHHMLVHPPHNIWKNLSMHPRSAVSSSIPHVPKLHTYTRINHNIHSFHSRNVYVVVCTHVTHVVCNSIYINMHRIRNSIYVCVCVCVCVISADIPTQTNRFRPLWAHSWIRMSERSEEIWTKKKRATCSKLHRLMLRCHCRRWKKCLRNRLYTSVYVYVCLCVRSCVCVLVYILHAKMPLSSMKEMLKKQGIYICVCVCVHTSC